MTLRSWIRRSTIGRIARRWRRASELIREQIELERRGKRVPALAGPSMQEE